MDSRTMKLGNEIRALRIARGWSQQEFAEQLGLPMFAFSKIESEPAELSISQLLEIAQLLNIPPSRLMSCLDENSIIISDKDLAKEDNVACHEKIEWLQTYVISLFEKLKKTQIELRALKEGRQ